MSFECPSVLVVAKNSLASVAGALLLLGVAAACGGQTSTRAEPSDAAPAALTSACDRYCAKLVTVTCDEPPVLSDCVSQCEQSSDEFSACEAQVDALRDCTTTHGTAMCQAYNGVAEVVAPPGACDAEHAALDACTGPDAQIPGPDGGIVSPDGGCVLVDGGCSEGCVPSGGCRYDPANDCCFTGECRTILCYDEQYIPPASPIPMLDPEGRCWVTNNTNYEAYGSLGWTDAPAECLKCQGSQTQCPATP